MIMKYHNGYYIINKEVFDMIADRIKQLRTSCRITQTDLAKKLNITRSSVNAWEMGISTPSTIWLNYLYYFMFQRIICLDLTIMQF